MFLDKTNDHFINGLYNLRGYTILSIVITILLISASLNPLHWSVPYIIIAVAIISFYMYGYFLVNAINYISMLRREIRSLKILVFMALVGLVLVIASVITYSIGSRALGYVLLVMGLGLVLVGTSSELFLLFKIASQTLNALYSLSAITSFISVIPVIISLPIGLIIRLIALIILYIAIYQTISYGTSLE